MTTLKDLELIDYKQAIYLYRMEYPIYLLQKDGSEVVAVTEQQVHVHYKTHQGFAYRKTDVNE